MWAVTFKLELILDLKAHSFSAEYMLPNVMSFWKSPVYLKSGILWKAFGEFRYKLKYENSKCRNKQVNRKVQSRMKTQVENKENNKIYVFLLFEVKPIVSIVSQNFPEEQFVSIKICPQKCSYNQWRIKRSVCGNHLVSSFSLVTLHMPSSTKDLEAF